MTTAMPPEYDSSNAPFNPMVAAVPNLKRISWGEIAAGVVIAIAIQMVLSLLGAGLGLGSMAG